MKKNKKQPLEVPPIETLEKELGAKFDDDVKVTVVESTPEHVHFVLPRA